MSYDTEKYADVFSTSINTSKSTKTEAPFFPCLIIITQKGPEYKTFRVVKSCSELPNGLSFRIVLTDIPPIAKMALESLYQCVGALDDE